MTNKLRQAEPAEQPAIPLPEHETEAMHDAVMAVIYQGVTRANTDALWQAYRRAILAAAPETLQPAKREPLTDEEIRQIYEQPELAGSYFPALKKITRAIRALKGDANVLE